MKNERQPIVIETEEQTGAEERHFKDISDYASELLTRAANEDADGVKRLLLQRGDFGNKKMLGEDEIWIWMEDYEAKHPEYKFGFKLNKEGILEKK